MLLPELAAVLGVSIDELFESSQEQHLTRIEAMLENEVMLSREDFDYAMNRAQEIARTKQERGRCLTLMSELSMQRARGYMNMAAEYAKQALAEEPEKKVNHALLGDAMQGCKRDWCCTNHSELIDYYFDFLQAHPEDTLGRMYLLDNLIDDGRLEEAERELAALRERRGDGFYVPMYEGMIAQKRGELEKAEACFDAMTKTYADDWRAWFERADEYAKQGRDREAIEAYKRGDALQEKPRMTDIQESIAPNPSRELSSLHPFFASRRFKEVLGNDAHARRMLNWFIPARSGEGSLRDNIPQAGFGAAAPSFPFLARSIKRRSEGERYLFLCQTMWHTRRSGAS